MQHKKIPAVPVTRPEIPAVKTGRNNSLIDIEGIKVGHFTDRESASGVTVVLCPEGATAGVDVRGSAPEHS